MKDVSTTGLGDRERQAWSPVLSFGHGALVASVVAFLAAGFTAVHQIESALGSFVPDRQLHEITGNVVILMLATLVARSVADRQLRTMPDAASVARRCGVLLALALLLALPPVRTLTFGSPARAVPGPAAAAAASDVRVTSAAHG